MKKFYSIILILGFTFLFVNQTFAAEVKKEDSVLSVEESVIELITTRDGNPLSEEKEIELRKKILAEVIKLSSEEVEKLKAKFVSLPEFDEESIENDIKTKLSKDLDTYSEYYTTQSEKLDNLQKLADIKELAQEIKDHRDNVYNPGVKEVLNFVLIFYDEDVLVVANTRLNKISTDINKLEELGYLKTNQFSTQINESMQLLSDAMQLQKEAKTLIFASYKNQEDTTELTQDETDKTLIETDEDTPDEETVEPNLLIEESLGKVKSAYAIFLQIGKDVREILGIK